MLQSIVNAGGGTVVAAIAVTGKHCEFINTAGGGAGATAVCTWSANPSVGETIHCTGADFGGTSNAFSFTDNAGTPNTYTNNGSRYRGTGIGGDYQFFDTGAISNSPSTTTVSRTGALFMGLGCFSTTGGLSTADGAVGTFSQNVGVGATLTATIVPTGSADIAECFGTSTGGTNIHPGTGYTAISTIASNEMVIYKLLSASGSQSATMTLEGSFAADMICSTYK